MSAKRTDPEILIDAYFRNARDWRKKKPDWWAWEEVNEIVQDDSPAAAWELVLEMVRRAPEELLGNVSAGPLEDLMKRAGRELIDDIETASRREPRVREALSGIWIRWGALPDPVMARLIRASGNAINPLPRDPGSGPPRR